MNRSAGDFPAVQGQGLHGWSHSERVTGEMLWFLLWGLTEVLGGVVLTARDGAVHHCAGGNGTSRRHGSSHRPPAEALCRFP